MRAALIISEAKHQFEYFFVLHAKVYVNQSYKVVSWILLGYELINSWFSLLIFLIKKKRHLVTYLAER